MKHNRTKGGERPAVEAAAPKQKKQKILFGRWLMLAAVAVWALLAFYESSLLHRVDEQSLFVLDGTFFQNSMKVPAGLLAYAACFLVSFFAVPALGAAIFVGLLALLYLLVKKVFAVPERWSLLAALPSLFILASDTQLGYWIFYIKHPGYWYVALLGTLVALLAVWAFRKMSWKIRLLFVVLWTMLAFPLFGVYALLASACMAVLGVVLARNAGHKHAFFAGVVTAIIAISLIVAVPFYWYEFYSTVAKEYIHTVGLPTYQWVLGGDHFVASIWPYWVPFVLLFASILLFAVFYGRIPAEGKNGKRYKFTLAAVTLAAVAFACCYWYSDTNFRVENLQNEAMWEQDWRRTAELTRETSLPSRQIVMNKNIALLYMGTAGEQMFTYPDGSSEIDAPMKVHLTQTGGKMAYYCYGKFNFSYRWCVEDAVEYGWKVEYLKHAARCMLLSGQYKIAERYINILKHTLFHRGWAEKYEKYLDNPALVSKAPEFAVPLQMYSAYSDFLDVDESFVEVWLLNNLSRYSEPNSPSVYSEASLMAALTRKDAKTFWPAMQRYLSTYKNKLRLPTHYQEALLLFSNINRGYDISKIPIENAVRNRFNEFMKKTKNYKGMKEKEMAPYFKDDFGDTYWYFYFFVREIKSN